MQCVLLNALVLLQDKKNYFDWFASCQSCAFHQTEMDLEESKVNGEDDGDQNDSMDDSE